ncbi:riboflavin biosynthesis pyrimidine reductase [Naumannella cuiyingiana]|uniref:Riboflavin biosynthesis pyrimidine reductase n=1 Tax=Naumannella cuiyingiana TaxID=1347891 RepID=A0A7Z0D940_9ACTN|nr:pyrimidine reductase family protein [Naumannella cuiyingiana]NYI71213.1 riboflavin biosynthesis pyrimidine reductase [Naumannella cuiyingiana]
MRQLYPEPADLGPLDAYALPAGRDWLRSNMVTSIDGAAQIDGRVGGLTGDADQAVLTALRALADVVLVGAQTVRVEGYGPLTLPPRLAELRTAAGRPAEPPLAIITRTARLDPGSPIFTDAATRPILIIPGGAAVPTAIRDSADILVAGDGELDLADAVRGLRELGLRQILSEGGPSTLGRLLAADLVDEVCVTTTPQIVAGDGARLTSGVPVSDRRFELARLLLADDQLFARWQRAR